MLAFSSIKNSWVTRLTVAGGLVFAVAYGLYLAVFNNPRDSRETIETKVSHSGTVSATSLSTSRSSQPHLAATLAISPDPLKTLLERLKNLSRDSVQRQRELDLIAASVAKADLEETLDSLWIHLGTGEVRNLSRILLQRWAAESPESSSAWISNKSEGPGKQELSLNVATIWANKSVSDAANWVRQWPAGQKEAGLMAIAFEAAQQSPREALWLASELPSDEQRDGLITHAFRQWASDDPAASMDWAAQMEPSPLRDEVFANLSLSLSETDPMNAAAIALENLPPGKQQNDAVVGIVQRWVQNDPVKAATWVSAFPEGALRESVMESLVSLWSENSPDAAAEWLNGVPPGPSRDAAVSVLASKLAVDFPETAAVWADSIEDPQRREQELTNLGERWLIMDEAAARTWLESAELPEAVKAQLIERASRQQRASR